MKKDIKIYRVYFDGVYPVGNCLILSANNIEEARQLAEITITHTDNIAVEEVIITDKPMIIEYINGDY